jgi:hypothetical protein
MTTADDLADELSHALGDAAADRLVVEREWLIGGETYIADLWAPASAPELVRRSDGRRFRVDVNVAVAELAVADARTPDRPGPGGAEAADLAGPVPRAGAASLAPPSRTAQPEADLIGRVPGGDPSTSRTRSRRPRRAARQGRGCSAPARRPCAAGGQSPPAAPRGPRWPGQRVRPQELARAAAELPPEEAARLLANARRATEHADGKAEKLAVVSSVLAVALLTPRWGGVPAALAAIAGAALAGALLALLATLWARLGPSRGVFLAAGRDARAELADVAATALRKYRLCNVAAALAGVAVLAGVAAVAAGGVA